MQTIKKLDVWSVGKIMALFGVVMGLLLGILMATLSGIAPADLPAEASSLLVGWKSLITMPIFYAIMYFVVGILTAFVYNLLARWVGGIKIELGK